METALLPPGLHDRNLDEIHALCVRAFPASHTRPGIFAGLAEFCATLAGFGVPVELWVDGSFATDKENPNDVDVTVAMRESDFNRLPDVLRMGLAAIFRNRDKTRATWQVDAYIFFHEDRQLAAYWADWFGHSRTGAPKGIIRLRQQP